MWGGVSWKRQPAGLKAGAQRSPGVAWGHTVSGTWTFACISVPPINTVSSHWWPLNGSIPHYYSKGAVIWEALRPGISAEADRPMGAPEVSLGPRGLVLHPAREVFGPFWAQPPVVKPWSLGRSGEGNPAPGGWTRLKTRGWGPGADKIPFSSRSSSPPCTRTSRGCTS